jgi:outer membrane protein assembly factor BamB
MIRHEFNDDKPFKLRDQYHLTAYSAASLQKLWTSKLDGDEGEENFMVVGDRVVVYTLERTKVDLYDTADGKLVASTALSDGVMSACSGSGAPGALFLRLLDARTVVLDLKTALATPWKDPRTPSWCEPRCADMPRAPRCRPSEPADWRRKYDGYWIRYLVRGESADMVVAEKYQGTHFPLFVAFEPGTAKEKWNVWPRSEATFSAFGEGDQEDGVVTLSYSSDKGATFVALDAKTGAELWKKSPVGGNYARLGPRVMIWNSDALRLFDAKSGEEQGTILPE